MCLHFWHTSIDVSLPPKSISANEMRGSGSGLSGGAGADDPADDEVNAGVEGLESFTLLKLLGVNVVLRRFLWFGAGGWRFLITCKYCQHKFAHGSCMYLAKRRKWKISRD